MEWAIVSATFLGPVFAVMITLFIQSRNQLRERKTQLVRWLVSSRNLKASPEYYLSLTLIPIEFSKNKKVLAARRALIQKSTDGTAENEQKMSEIDNLISDLVFEMMRDLGYRAYHSDVRNIAYTPNIVHFRDNLYLDSLLSQRFIANELAKSAFVSRKMAEKMEIVIDDDEINLPFPPKSQDPES